MLPARIMKRPEVRLIGIPLIVTGSVLPAIIPLIPNTSGSARIILAILVFVATAVFVLIFDLLTSGGIFKQTVPDESVILNSQVVTDPDQKLANDVYKVT